MSAGAGSPLQAPGLTEANEDKEGFPSQISTFVFFAAFCKKSFLMSGMQELTPPFNRQPTSHKARNSRVASRVPASLIANHQSTTLTAEDAGSAGVWVSE